MKKMKQLWSRLTFLATGKAVWVDQLTGKSEECIEPWKLRWAMVGVQSYRWRWVRKLGQLECGCTRNPITRRFVLFSTDCPRSRGFAFHSDGES